MELYDWPARAVEATVVVLVVLGEDYYLLFLDHVAYAAVYYGSL